MALRVRVLLARSARRSGGAADTWHCGGRGGRGEEGEGVTAVIGRRTAAQYEAGAGGREEIKEEEMRNDETRQEQGVAGVGVLAL